jgi:hypothetical protein
LVQVDIVDRLIRELSVIYPYDVRAGTDVPAVHGEAGGVGCTGDFDIGSEAGWSAIGVRRVWGVFQSTLGGGGESRNLVGPVDILIVLRFRLERDFGARILPARRSGQSRAWKYGPSGWRRRAVVLGRRSKNLAPPRRRGNNRDADSAVLAGSEGWYDRGRFDRWW